MKIQHLELPSGTTDGIPLLIDANLSTDQAVAVFELIDDLREQNRPPLRTPDPRVLPAQPRNGRGARRTQSKTAPNLPVQENRRGVGVR